jgi:hypothetical protein
MQSRTFLREDQLAQHIKRAHISTDVTRPRISKELMSAWKIDNPAFSKSFLRCGFCGMVSDNWEQRQDHVHDHLKKGVCKSSWWPERQPEIHRANMVQISNNYVISNTFVFTGTSDGSFCCPTCGLQFEDFLAATRLHPTCESWSCRYLHDELSMMKNLKACRLCDFFAIDAQYINEALISDLREHVEYHQLRGCTQTIYTTPKDFASHLGSEHRMKDALDRNMAPWVRLQFLDIIDGQELVRTVRLLADGRCCPNVMTDLHSSFRAQEAWFKTALKYD